MTEADFKALRSDYQALLEKGDLAGALPLIRQCAYWGDLDSQKLAADILLGRTMNHPKADWLALEYLQMAAMNQDAGAMKDLADLYIDGEKCPHSNEKAFYWMNKAAAAGNTDAFDPLGMMYLQGIAVARDLKQAKIWLTKAEAADAPAAKKHLKMLELLEQKTNAK